MNIVQVPRRFVKSEWGGTETVVLETSRRLLELGHQTEILCPNALAQINDESIEGVQVRRFPYFYPYLGLDRSAQRQLDQKGGNLFSFRLLWALQNLRELDLIHLHTLKRLGGIGRRAAQKQDVPYVVSLHGGVFDVPEAESKSMTEPTSGALEWGKLLGWYVGSRRVLDDAAAIICVGLEEKRQVEARYPGKRVVHLPNGVHAERFAKGDGALFRTKHGIPAGARLILTVGRIDPQKNQLLALGALPRLMKEIPNLHYVLAGPVTNDAYRDRIVATTRELGLESRVKLIQGIPSSSQELVDAYHAADIFLLPSIHETFGIVILEAWAANRPVIATRVGGVPSFVEHEKDALLIPSGDAAALEEAVLRLARSPDLARELATRGLRKAREEYSWTRITQRLVGLYEEVVREHRHRA